MIRLLSSWRWRWRWRWTWGSCLLYRFQNQSPEVVFSAATHPDPGPLLLSSVKKIKNAQGSIQDEDEVTDDYF